MLAGVLRLHVDQHEDEVWRHRQRLDCGVQEQQPAVSLLGVVIAKRPAIAEFLVGEGALKAAVALLASGGSFSTCWWSDMLATDESESDAAAVDTCHRD